MTDVCKLYRNLPSLQHHSWLRFAVCQFCYAEVSKHGQQLDIRCQHFVLRFFSAVVLDYCITVKGWQRTNAHNLRHSNTTTFCLSWSEQTKEGVTRSSEALSKEQCISVVCVSVLPLFLTSILCPTSTNAQVGWKAPVPQAYRWVRL